MPTAVPTAHVPKLDHAIMAHRGLPTKAPENTMASFRSAAAAGADWVEMDVDILADGTPIVMHDSWLDRTTNKSGRFYDLEVSDLEGIDAGSWFSSEFAGEPIPTLREFIDFLNESGMNANIEIKGNEQGAARSQQLVDSVLTELKRLDPTRQMMISSFSQPILIRVSELAPQYALAVLFDKTSFGPDWLSVLEMCGASYANLEDDGLTPETVRQVTDAGFGVNVWTVNRTDRAKELFKWGCTSMITDVADRMVDAQLGAGS